MWLCTQYGFFSIVQKSRGEFHLRARLRGDLVNLRQLCSAAWEIHRSAPPADYRFRVVLNAAEVVAVVVALGQRIDYSNFKSRIHDRPDQRDKARAYLGLWGALVDLQD